MGGQEVPRIIHHHGQLVGQLRGAYLPLNAMQILYQSAPEVALRVKYFD